MYRTRPASSTMNMAAAEPSSRARNFSSLARSAPCVRLRSEMSRRMAVKNVPSVLFQVPSEISMGNTAPS